MDSFNAHASCTLKDKYTLKLEVEFASPATLRALRFLWPTKNHPLKEALDNFCENARGLELSDALKLPWKGDSYMPIPHWCLLKAHAQWVGEAPQWVDGGQTLLCRCFAVAVEEIVHLSQSSHALTLKAVGQHTRAGTGCTTCREDVRRLLIAVRKPENSDTVRPFSRHKIGDRTPLEVVCEAHQIALQFFQQRPKLRGGIELLQLRERQLFFRWEGGPMPPTQMHTWMADLERELALYFGDEVLLTLCP